MRDCLVVALTLALVVAPRTFAAERSSAANPLAPTLELMQTPDFSEVFIPLPGARVVRTDKMRDGLRWVVRGRVPLDGMLSRRMAAGPLKQVGLTCDGHLVTVRVIWRHEAQVKAALEAGGVRIRAGVRARAAKVQMDNGLAYQHVSRVTASGPLQIHVLRVDLGKWTLAPYLARTDREGGGLHAVDTVRHIADRAQAVAATNGSYFSGRDGHPIGLLVLDGEVVSSQYFNRSVFGIRIDGSCFVDHSKLLAGVETEDGKALLATSVNMPPKPDAVELFTYHYGATTRTPPRPDRLEFPIEKDGTVLAPVHGGATIPEEGFVVSAQGKPLAKLRATVHERMHVDLFTQLDGVWRGVRWAIGGGPTLVQDGKVMVDSAAERIAANIARGRAPRTAIGYLGDHRAVLVTVDGRQRKSVGVTLQELAGIMKDLGCQEAINLDGGGSTTMVMDGKVVNAVSDRSERAVNNAVVVLRAL